MDRRDCIITLTVRETGPVDRRVFLSSIHVDGEAVAGDQGLSEDATAAVRALANRYSALFEQPFMPEASGDDIASIGDALFGFWFARAWETIETRVPSGARHLLTIASDVADVLNLPWELLRPSGGEPIGVDARFSVRRQPWADRPPEVFTGPLPPRPLRVLFMACAPLDLPTLDHEREEEVVLKAVTRAGSAIAVDIADSGTFEELRRRINDFEPHVVHLDGHGGVESDGQGYFYFEDERGASDPRPAREISQRLFAGSSVQCAFVSGCQTGQAPLVAALGGICAGLVGDEVPLAIGWTASIDDEVATGIAATFYETLATGQPVDRALTQARQSVRPECEARDDPSWTLPVLYAATTQDRVVDPDPRRSSVEPPRRTTVQRPLPGMIEGYAEQVVGRRREIQRLLPSLRDGALQCALITGLGGAGKSTLATRLARALEGDGFIPIPVSSTAETPLSAARLLESCADAFLTAGLRGEYDTLRDPTLTSDVRLRQLVDALNRHRFTLVLDNLEVNLDEATRRFLDPDVGLFYLHLLTHLSGESRVLITSRYRPAEVVTFPPTAWDMPLGDFAEASFLKVLLRDGAIARRYETGDLPHALLAEVYHLLGGTPRFIVQIREILRTVETDDLASELASVRLPPEADAGQLQDARDRYCEWIVAGRLYDALGPRARRALSHAAVVGVPVPLDGLAAVSGMEGGEMAAIAREWQDYALAYREGDGDERERWAIYGVLRSWLLAPDRLPEDERRSAHRAAGEYLESMVDGGRRRDLGLSWSEVMLEMRAQYRAAGAHDQARIVTDRLGVEMIKWGLYEDIARLNQELLADEAHAAPMAWIAWTYFERGGYRSAREWSLRGLAAADDTMPFERARALHGLGSADIELGEYTAARASLWSALPIYQQLGKRAREAGIWHQLGAIDLYEGDDGAAREKLEKSLAIKRDIGAAVGEADTLWMLAVLDLNKGDRAGARVKVDLALEIRQRIGDHAGEAIARHGLASVALSEGSYEAARADFERALDIDRSIGAREKEASTIHQLAIIDFELDNSEEARAGFHTVLQMRRDSGNRADESLALYGLARIDLRDGDTTAARSKLTEALSIQHAIGHRVGKAMTLYGLAMVDIAEGAYAAGRANLLASLDIRRHLAGHMGDAAVWCELAKLDLRIDDGAAWSNFLSALEIARESGDVAGEAAALSGLATVTHGRGDAAGARALFEQILKIDRRAGDRAGEAEILNALALVAMGDQDYSGAFHKLLDALAIRRGMDDVKGEASAFYDLALLAHKVGREAQARRLGALSFILECRARRATNSIALLTELASRLRCAIGNITDMLAEAADAYEADHGKGLARSALQ